MKYKKLEDEHDDHERKPATGFTLRDRAEICVVLLIVAGGFILTMHFTSPPFCHSHLTNSTWWTNTGFGWTKPHTSAFDQFTQDDLDTSFDDVRENEGKGDSLESNPYHVQSLVAKIQNERNILFVEEKNPDFKVTGEHVGVDNIVADIQGDVETILHSKFMKTIEEDASTSTKQCDILPENQRFDCHPEQSTSAASCAARGCCWGRADGSHGNSSSSGVTMSVPDCYYPRNYDGYNVIDQNMESPSQMKVTLKRTTPTYYPRDVAELKMEISYETQYRLRIKISDPAEARWEVPMPRPKSVPRENIDNNMYSVQVPGENQPFHLTVTRKSSNTPLINTTGAFMFTDQFLQLSYFLPSTFIYGLGEHRDTLMHSVNWTNFVFWNKDQPPDEDTNLYGSHPFYLMMENDTNSHGVLLLNSNAMEAVLQPSPAITWRTIGGVLDFYIFLGPSPADVVSQYTEMIGRSFMPPYWSMGYHQCRWGYTTAQKTQDIANKLTKAGMPQDIQWNDADYMDGMKDFTTSPKFGDQKGLVDTLHSQGKHYMMIVDPGISSTQKPGSYHPYDLGLSMNIFINNTDDKPLVGRVWPGPTVFPDFTNPQAVEYWTTLVKTFQDSVKFDGMWIDMNEISNFVDGSTTGCSSTDRYENPPYLPGVKGGSLKSTTICASGKQYLSRTYNVHNLYGLGESYATNIALRAARPGKRPFIISRSTFPGQGHYGGHWTGDNDAQYYDMYKSISDILSFNMFGIPMVGSDICGFRHATNEALCQYSRRHAPAWTGGMDMEKETPAQACDHIAKAYSCQAWSRDQRVPAELHWSAVYLIRYSLLPYLYTLFFKSPHYGRNSSQASSFMEFPEDKSSYSVDKQFMWGPALMISPALEQNVTSVLAYFPRSTWFYFSNGRRMTDTGGTFNLPAPMNFINLNFRGGYIIPMQEPALTTTQSRKNNFWLVVAMPRNQFAKGELYWDDGDSVQVRFARTWTVGTSWGGLFSTIPQWLTTLCLRIRKPWGSRSGNSMASAKQGRRLPPFTTNATAFKSAYRSFEEQYRNAVQCLKVTIHSAYISVLQRQLLDVGGVEEDSSPSTLAKQLTEVQSHLARDSIRSSACQMMSAVMGLRRLWLSSRAVLFACHATGSAGAAIRDGFYPVPRAATVVRRRLEAVSTFKDSKPLLEQLSHASGQGPGCVSSKISFCRAKESVKWAQPLQSAEGSPGPQLDLAPVVRQHGATVDIALAKRWVEDAPIQQALARMWVHTQGYEADSPHSRVANSSFTVVDTGREFIQGAPFGHPIARSLNSDGRLHRNTLRSNIVTAGYTAEPMILGNVTVLGVTSSPKTVTVNGIRTQFTYSSFQEVIYVTEFRAKMLRPFTMTWTF
ncbi:lysosomal alpha-glucosidase-like [Haliotis rubra]|uniref:lysosomal alpha-glucosidase-like n=1 Tax=Haliotis rubra TaxID=36100 RepID=UPI001EE5F5CF|nr:lysosomal alpha-glucosidase-like [Haliotis rubra]